VNKVLNVSIRRIVADDCDVQISVPVKIQSAPERLDDPIALVAKRPTAKECEEYPLAPISNRIQDRRTNRRFIGCLKHKPREFLP
jgi:hypothetical protein